MLLSSPVLKAQRHPRDHHDQQQLYNQNPRVAQITSLDYINAHEDALLLVACDDGTLRMYKDYDEEGEDLLGGNLEER